MLIIFLDFLCNLIYDVSGIGSLAIIKAIKFQLRVIALTMQAVLLCTFLRIDRIDSETSNIANIRSNYLVTGTFGLL